MAVACNAVSLLCRQSLTAKNPMSRRCNISTRFVSCAKNNHQTGTGRLYTLSFTRPVAVLLLRRMTRLRRDITLANDVVVHCSSAIPLYNLNPQLRRCLAVKPLRSSDAAASFRKAITSRILSVRRSTAWSDGPAPTPARSMRRRTVFQTHPTGSRTSALFLLIDTENTKYGYAPPHPTPISQPLITIS